MLSLTSRQADRATALALGVFLHHEDALLAQPPKPEVSCLAGGVKFFNSRAQDGPMIRHYGRKHGRDAHNNDQEGDLHLGLLVLQHPGAADMFSKLKKGIVLFLLEIMRWVYPKLNTTTTGSLTAARCPQISASAWKKGVRYQCSSFISLPPCKAVKRLVQ